MPNDVINLPSGGVPAYGGRNAPSPYPLWRTGLPLDEWMAIPNTSGAGGADVEEFSGMTVARGSKIIAPLCGGHNLSDNRVVGIDLSMDAPGWDGVPGWKILNQPSAIADRVRGVSHYLDGKPTSRHVRHLAHYMPALDRVVMLGAHDIYAAAGGSKPTVDSFNLDTLEWLPAHTYPDVINGAVNGGAIVDANGDGWAAGTYKFTAATLTWWAPLTQQATWNVRYPWCLAAERNMIFGLCYGDGYTGGAGGLGGPDGDGLLAIRQVGNVQTNMTIKPSAARAQFIADKPVDAGMDYNPIGDYFLFFTGRADGRMYKVIPNDTTAWDMEIFAYSGGSPPPYAITVCSRFRYCAAYKGFIYLADQTKNLYFMATAD